MADTAPPDFIAAADKAYKLGTSDPASAGADFADDETRPNADEVHDLPRAQVVFDRS